MPRACGQSDQPTSQLAPEVIRDQLRPPSMLSNRPALAGIVPHASSPMLTRNALAPTHHPAPVLASVGAQVSPSSTLRFTWPVLSLPSDVVISSVDGVVGFTATSRASSVPLFSTQLTPPLMLL